MKDYIRKNKILLAIVVVGFVAACIAVGGRMNVESNNKQYDVVLDYQEIENMASQSDESLDWWFTQFKDMGINKVGVLEESLNSIVEYTKMPVAVDVMYQIGKSADWEKEFPADFVRAMEDRGYDDYDVVVQTKSKEAFDFIESGLTARWDSDRYILSPQDNGGCIWIDGSAKDALYSEVYKKMDSKKTGFSQQDEVVGSKVMYLSLGLLPERVQRLETLGMEVIPRTASYNHWNDETYAKAVLKGYDQLATPPTYIISAGQAVIGADDNTNIVKDYIEKNGITISLIENTTQLQNIMQTGLRSVVENTGFQAVRVFSVWDYIQNRYQYYGYSGAQEIENTLFRAITERNVRVIYYKPIREFKDYHVYVTDVEEYRTMFSNLNERLERHNIQLGEAAVMDAYRVRNLLKALMGIGCVAAGILLLDTFLPLKKKWAYGLLGVGSLGVLGAYFVMPSLAQHIGSFAAAVIFPCLAAVFLTNMAKNCFDTMDKQEKTGKIIVTAGMALVIAVAVSLAGGIMTAAPLSEIRYMLEIEVFRGVKLAQLLPLAFFVVAYLAYFGFRQAKKVPGRLEFHDIKEIMTLKIQIWMVAVAVVLAGVGAYYIIRTGHDTAVQPSTLEMLFRNELEDLLLARPRNKEFLFAFPAAMMFIYCAARKWKLWSALFGLSAVIGMTSVVNTFMHIRTPLYLGLTRTAYSLCFGLIIGAVGVLIFEMLYRVCKKVGAKYFHV